MSSKPRPRRGTAGRPDSPPAREHGYLHGYTAGEQARLYRQARFLEDAVHDRLPFRRCRKLLEVGCGVGAKTEILLRRFPERAHTQPRTRADAGAVLEVVRSQRGRSDAWALDAVRKGGDALRAALRHDPVPEALVAALMQRPTRGTALQLAALLGERDCPEHTRHAIAWALQRQLGLAQPLPVDRGIRTAASRRGCQQRSGAARAGLRRRGRERAATG